jgi:hypothetical protein
VDLVNVTACSESASFLFACPPSIGFKPKVSLRKSLVLLPLRIGCFDSQAQGQIPEKWFLRLCVLIQDLVGARHYGDWAEGPWTLPAYGRGIGGRAVLGGE